jgi:hypothetical protein
MYCATYVDKVVDRDFQDTGCEGKQRTVISERIDISSQTLSGLLKKITDTYGYDGKYWGMAEDCSWVEFNQAEDNDSNPIDFDRCKHLWSSGQPVYLCDYSFRVEYRETRDVTNDEFRLAVKELGASFG